MSMRIGSECSLATRILATRYSLLAVFIHLGMRPAYGELLFDNLKPAERP